MASIPSDNLVKVATLKKPYGIQGWLWIFSDTEDREAIFSMKPWVINTAMGQKTLTVKNWRPQGKGYVVQLNEVPDRTMAETMYNVSIWSDKDGLQALAEDEYYWADLVGLTVISEPDNVSLGRVKELFETGAHAIMVVEPTAESVDAEERLIPWHKQTIVSVDLANKTLVVDWGRDY
ncbi:MULTISPECIES: ribosome maturation factor RimM [unclassified Moraxella]|uniref:ribosome maturation factor RimM n=1 Tax=unclassified Moraxella TaxID=2685852 RepID=UPI003AF8FCAA